LKLQLISKGNIGLIMSVRYEGLKMHLVKRKLEFDTLWEYQYSLRLLLYSVLFGAIRGLRDMPIPVQAVIPNAYIQ
jgi:hypothetical protein